MFAILLVNFWFYFYISNILALFTTNERVTSLIIDIMPLVVTGQVLNHWYCFLKGMVQAMGIQSQVVAMYIFAFYVVNMPIAVYSIMKA
mmetsp:Transcript_9339/g.14112  ORF Transcript_9339/g.14112 Transcript_9339/m.14112 type:complete len:89 (+) Transcript_9339:171-437(+)